MISFVTLFLGLVTGSGQLVLTVSGPIAAAVVELDGATVGRIKGPPWTLDVDFGPALVPHELIAKALDKEGREISRSRQLINVPRPVAEVRILLERDAKGEVVSALLSGQSLLGSRTRQADATFDGKVLLVDEAWRVKLPPYDHRKAHVLTAQLEFTSPGGMYTVRSHADAVVGGSSEGQAEGELTAVPIRLPDGAPAKSREQLQGLFVKAGEPLNVVAVDHGPAEVWIVRDMGSEEAGRKLGRRSLQGVVVFLVEHQLEPPGRRRSRAIRLAHGQAVRRGGRVVRPSRPVAGPERRALPDSHRRLSSGEERSDSAILRCRRGRRPSGAPERHSPRRPSRPRRRRGGRGKPLLARTGQALPGGRSESPVRLDSATERRVSRRMAGEKRKTFPVPPPSPKLSANSATTSTRSTSSGSRAGISRRTSNSRGRRAT